MSGKHPGGAAAAAAAAGVPGLGTITCEAVGYAAFLEKHVCPRRHVASGGPPVQPLGESLCRPGGRQQYISWLTVNEWTREKSPSNPGPPVSRLGMSWLWNSGLLLWLARPCRSPDLGAGRAMRLCLRRPSCLVASVHQPGVSRLALLDLCLHHLTWEQHRPNLESQSGICQYSCEQAWVLVGKKSSGQGGTRRLSQMQTVGV